MFFYLKSFFFYANNHKSFHFQINIYFKYVVKATQEFQNRISYCHYRRSSIVFSVQ